MENNGFIVIQGWMVNELSLSGNELICYALIFGFSQDGESEFKGSQSYVAKSLGVTRENARRILKRLVDNGYIIKRDEDINGVKFCRYSSNMNKVSQMMQGASKQCRGSIKTEHNNINNNIDKETISLNNKDIEKKNSENFSDEQSLQLAAEPSPLEAEKQEKEKKNSAKRKESANAEAVKDYYNSKVEGLPCMLPKVLKMTAERVSAVTARISEYGIETVCKVIDKAVASDFLNGRIGDGTFRASFDWIMKPRNFPKIYEGNYDNRASGNNMPQQREKKRDVSEVYYTYTGVGSKRYQKFMEWLAKNAPYIYERYTVLIDYIQFDKMVTDNKDAITVSNIITALNDNTVEREKHDNLYEYLKAKFDGQR